MTSLAKNQKVFVVKPALAEEAPTLTVVKDAAEEIKDESPKTKVIELTPEHAPVVETVPAPAALIVKEEPRRLTLDEKIQRVEDLTLLIERFRALAESRRKLQTFHIGADSMSSTILLRDSAGNEFKTSNSSVITTVIDAMKQILDMKVREVETQINF
jgi:hypothetical protein